MIVSVPDGSGRTIEVRSEDSEYAQQRAAEWGYENPIIERGAQLGEEDISAFGDAVSAVGAGVVNIGEGLATIPSDFLGYGDEQDRQEVVSFFAKYRPEVHTELGEAVKFITQFGLSGGVVGKAVKGLSSLGKVGAYAATDIAVATPDVETLGDFFEAGPTQRIDIDDLDGAELASARLRNRFNVGVEGAAIVLGVPQIAKLGIMGIGGAASAIGKTDLAKAAAQAIADPNTPFHNVGVKPDLGDPGFIRGNIKRLYKKYMTFQGDMPDRFTAQYEALRVHEVAAQNNLASQAVEKIDRTMAFVNKNKGLFNNQDKSQILEAVNDYLFAESKFTGSKKLSKEVVKTNAANKLKEIDDIISKNLPRSFFKEKKDFSLFRGADDLRVQIDDMSGSVQDMLRDPILDPGMQKQLIETIGDNKTFYGMRLYRAIKDTSYQPTMDQQSRAVKELVDSSQGLADEFKLDETSARAILNNMLQSDFSNAKMTPKDITEVPTLTGVSQGMLKGRRLDNLPAVRDFLGEYTGAKDVMMRSKPELIRTRDFAEQEIGLRTKMVETVDVMSKQIAKNRYYTDLVNYNKKLGDLGEGKFLFDEIPPDGKLGAYSRIGLESSNPSAKAVERAKRRFGPLAGKYVLNEHKAAFENTSTAFDLSNGAIPLYSTFLGLKGVSQVMKTVYSPTTQVRNATTAGAYVLANGNIGNAKSLGNAFSTVFSNLNQRLTGPGKGNSTLAARKEYYSELIDLGIVNTNAKVGEFEALLSDAVNTTDAFTPGLSKKLFKKAQNMQNGFAAKLYQASDDVWKTYSFEMELGKLENALLKNSNTEIRLSDARNFTELGASFSTANLNKLTDNDLTKMFKSLNKNKGLEDFARADRSQKLDSLTKTILKKEAAEIVKDTVPNYARVPQAIKQLRQMPFGNFVAFPAEMIRTGGNILNRAVKEIASESPEIRAIGMKRLTGMMAVNYAIPKTLMVAGTTLTGADEEQVQAYKRSMGASWDRNSTLIPIATDKDGYITDIYNFSYTNPYDYLKRPFSAIYNAVETGVTKEEDLNNIAFNAGYEALGEFFSPFMSESIVTEKIFDLSRNQTSYGRSVFGQNDPLGLKLAKGFAHFAEGLMPGGSPVDITADIGSPINLNLRLNDLPRAVASTVTGDARLGVNKQGYRLDAAQEFAEALTGAKSIKPRVNRVLYYRAIEASKNVRDSAGIFNQVAKSRGNVDAEGLTQAYISANEQRFKALRDLNMAIEDARTLGLSNQEIIKPLRDAKTPNLSMLMQGRFNAFFPSSETMATAFRGNEDKLKNAIDLTAISKVRSGVHGSLFRPQAAAEVQAQQLAAQPLAQGQPATPMSPTQAGTPPGQPQPGAPTPPTPPQSLFDRGIEALKQVELNKLLGID